LASLGKVRNAVENEDCHGVLSRRSSESEAGSLKRSRAKHRILTIIVSNYALASLGKEMKGFTYVYILLNDKDATHRYTGLTDNLEARLKSHSQGNNPHTSKYRPWRIETAIAFRSREKAVAFEKYLKSHSGRAFASKHF
jgi:predicted GIY-YIG superfamily endonuclease